VGINPGPSGCDHRYPTMVYLAGRGSYYARWLVCLVIRPERPSLEAARQALLVMESSRDGGYQGMGA
jgi:hypothetical protein